MGFLKKLLGKKEQERRKREIVKSPSGDFEDVLNLGWHYSENKKEWQMAKIREKDRAVHLYIVGASGTGKSKFLES